MLYSKATKVHEIFWDWVFGIQAIGEVAVEEVVRAATESCLCENKCQLAPSYQRLTIVGLHNVHILNHISQCKSGEHDRGFHLQRIEICSCQLPVAVAFVLSDVMAQSGDWRCWRLSPHLRTRNGAWRCWRLGPHLRTPNGAWLCWHVGLVLHIPNGAWRCNEGPYQDRPPLCPFRLLLLLIYSGSTIAFLKFQGPKSKNIENKILLQP